LFTDKIKLLTNTEEDDIEEENEKKSIEIQEIESEPDSPSESESEQKPKREQTSEPKQEPKTESEQKSEQKSEPEPEPNPVPIQDDIITHLSKIYLEYQSNVYCEINNKHELLINRIKDFHREEENIKISNTENSLLHNNDNDNKDIICRCILEQKCIFVKTLDTQLEMTIQQLQNCLIFSCKLFQSLQVDVESYFKRVWDLIVKIQLDLTNSKTLCKSIKELSKNYFFKLFEHLAKCRVKSLTKEISANKPEKATVSKPETATASKPETATANKPETATANKPENAAANKPENAAAIKSESTTISKPKKKKRKSKNTTKREVTTSKSTDTTNKSTDPITNESKNPTSKSTEVTKSKQEESKTSKPIASTKNKSEDVTINRLPFVTIDEITNIGDSIEENDTFYITQNKIFHFANIIFSEKKPNAKDYKKHIKRDSEKVTPEYINQVDEIRVGFLKKMSFLYEQTKILRSLSAKIVGDCTLLKSKQLIQKMKNLITISSLAIQYGDDVSDQFQKIQNRFYIPASWELRCVKNTDQRRWGYILSTIRRKFIEKKYKKSEIVRIIKEFENPDYSILLKEKMSELQEVIKEKKPIFDKMKDEVDFFKEKFPTWKPGDKYICYAEKWIASANIRMNKMYDLEKQLQQKIEEENTALNSVADHLKKHHTNLLEENTHRSTMNLILILVIEENNKFNYDNFINSFSFYCHLHCFHEKHLREFLKLNIEEEKFKVCCFDDIKGFFKEFNGNEDIAAIGGTDTALKTIRLCSVYHLLRKNSADFIAFVYLGLMQWSCMNKNIPRIEMCARLMSAVSLQPESKFREIKNKVINTLYFHGPTKDIKKQNNYTTKIRVDNIETLLRIFKRCDLNKILKEQVTDIAKEISKLSGLHKRESASSKFFYLLY